MLYLGTPLKICQVLNLHRNKIFQRAKPFSSDFSTLVQMVQPLYTIDEELLTKPK